MTSKFSVLALLADLFFILLFPCYFFYNVFLVFGYIPPVLGGYFGLVSVLSLSSFLLAFTIGVQNLSIRGGLLPSLCWSYFAVMIIFPVLYFVSDQPALGTLELLSWSVSKAFLIINICLIFAFLRPEKLILPVLLLFVCMAPIVVMNVNDSGMFYLKLIADESATDSIATYQGFGRSIVVCGLFLCAMFILSPTKLIFTYLTCVALLFLNGSRTEFVVFALTVPFAHMIVTRAVKPVLSFLGFAMLPMFVAGYLISDILPSSRIFELADILVSSSFLGRLNLTAIGWAEIYDAPILGRYGAYYSAHGIGGYPHNILSAWLNLGLVGIMLLIFIFSTLWLYALRRDEFTQSNPTFALFVVFLVFVTISLIVSKSYIYELLAAPIGLWFAQTKARKRAKTMCSRYEVVSHSF